MRYRYRSDDELKDSGVEWIGKIPKDWEVIKLKHKCTFLNGYAFKSEDLDIDNDVPVVRIGDINENGIDLYKILKVKKDLTQSLDLYKIKKGDTLIAMSGATVGKAMFILKNNGELINQRVGIMRPKNINPKYLHYSINNTKFKNEILISSVGGAQENISSENIKDKYTVKLYIDEQEKIANFLDEKTSQFDLIISKKEKLIERLEEAKKSLISEIITGKVKVVKTDDGYELIKRSSEDMKDSGVEWLGEIPKNWEVKRIKQISSVISKGTTPSTVGKEIIDKGEIRFLKAENIYEGKISLTPEFFIDEETNKILKRSELKENDILFVIAGATIGKVAIVQKEHCPANTNQAISFIRLYNDVNYKFVYYWLNSPKLQENMWLYAVQSAQPNLSMENLGNFYITYPCNYEIDILTDYIEKKDIEINDIIKNIKYQIEKLKEAKQSLISEAVTGKIEILD